MKKRILIKVTTCLLLITSIVSCTEPFEIENNDFEKAIVVEATITNEFKQHRILLSNAYRIDESSTSPISNATVTVIDDQNNTYNFSESIIQGTYVSNNPFSAQKGVNYQLQILTSDGRTYKSHNTKYLSESNISDVYVSLDKNIEGNDQFNINVDSNDPSNNSKYYRYTYSETYKIIAPFWSAREAIVLATDPPSVAIQTKTNLNNRICYRTNESKDIIQTETTDLNEDRVSKFPVRKISADDFIVSHRYSILVKQYVQSFEAHKYYSILNKFSSASNVLSQSQPGFFSGNIYSESDKNEKVLGFFEVSFMSEKRAFFNYRDFFPFGRPDHIETCYYIAPENVNGPGGNALVAALSGGDWIFYDDNPNVDDSYPGPYLLYPKACGDCTVLGSNVKPSFWLD